MGHRAGKKRSRPTVRVGSLLRELIPEFLEHRRLDAKALEDAVSNDDYQTIEWLGHQLWGSGASLGFPPISEIGEALEAAAAARDGEVIRGLVNQFAHYLDQIDVVYD